MKSLYQQRIAERISEHEHDNNECNEERISLFVFNLTCSPATTIHV